MVSALSWSSPDSRKSGNSTRYWQGPPSCSHGLATFPCTAWRWRTTTGRRDERVTDPGRRQVSRATGRRGSDPSTSVGCVRPVRARPAPVRGELVEPQAVSNEAARAIRNAHLCPAPSLLVNLPGACRRACPEPVNGETPSNHSRLSLAVSRTLQSLPALPAMPPTHALPALLPLTSSPTFAVPGPASPLPSIHQPLASSPASSRRLQPGPSSTQQAEPTPAFLVSQSNHTPFTPASQAHHPLALRPHPVPLRTARHYPPPTCHLPPDIVL